MSRSQESQDIPSLWNFATDYYAQPGIAETCLRLQDEHQFDINLLLFCCWYGVYYGVVEEALLQTLFEYSCNWQENAVQPLRQTRRWLKTAITASPGDKRSLANLHEQVKALELESERQQLETLASMARAIHPGELDLSERDRCAENLAALQRLMQNAGDETIASLMRGLLQALPDEEK